MGTSAYQLQRSIEANTIHGLSRTRVYHKWVGMKRRCLDKKNKQYPFYGGRGITVCKRWMDFRNFISDMGMPDDGLTIERINNDRGYCPSNCRWATAAEQNRNKSSLLMFTIEGERRCASEWARIYGVHAYNVINRLKLGWSIHRALTTKDGRYKHGRYAKKI